MFKSIFTKYISAFLIIILASLILSTTIIATVLTMYDGNTKNRALENISIGTVSFLQGSLESDDPEYFNEFIKKNHYSLETIMTLLCVNTDDVVIFLANQDGEMIVAAGVEHTGEFIGENGLVKEGMVLSSGIRSDKSLSYGKIFKNTLDGMFEDNQKTYVKSINSDDGTPIGYVVARIMKSDMDDLISATIQTIVVSFLFLMLVALIAVYFLTEKLVSPLREMSRAAKEFALGHFDVRVRVKGNDEAAELAEAFNNMASTLQRSEETRRLFLANVSHDLRTPMTTIKGFVDSILNGAIPEEQIPHYLEIISSEIKRLSRLVSNLLDITKIQAGERTFTMAPFDICEMAREIIISSEQRLEEKKLDVEFDADEDNMFVNADKDAIYQVLYNLCDNGIKFSKEGAKYTVGIHADDDGVNISVYNEGDGIPEDEIPLVFDRFYKSDRSRGLDKTGSGLGLYISRTIIEAHEKKISVESEFGKWCKFKFSLDKADSPKKQRGDKTNVV